MCYALNLTFLCIIHGPGSIPPLPPCSELRVFGRHRPELGLSDATSLNSELGLSDATALNSAFRAPPFGTRPFGRHFPEL